MADHRQGMPRPDGAGRGHSRRGLLRAGIGGAAALGVAGIGYAAFRLDSGGGTAGSGAAASSAGAAGTAGAGSGASPGAGATTRPGGGSGGSASYVYQRQHGPDRTIVSTSSGTQVAVLTDGARTVVFTGPMRTFAEPYTTAATISTSAWVRLAPKRWSEGAQDEAWFESWFGGQAASRAPDLFGLYTEYAAGAPNRYDGKVRYAGAAKFGVLTNTAGYQNPLGDRDDRADFYDYLGVDYDFPDGVGKPHGEWYGDLDCSGLVRILYGYRMGYPMYLGDGSGSGSAGTLPRHSYSMSTNGPGPTLFGASASSAPSVDELGMLQAGDLLFFAEGSDPSSVDHCGVYFGTDQYGSHRFFSSRMGANGPTFGDAEGLSVVGGTGVYSRTFRGARRI